MKTTAAHSNTSSSDQALIASLTKTLRSLHHTQRQEEDEKNDTRRCMVPSTEHPRDDDVSYALLQAEYQQSQRQIARLERQVMELKEKMRQREIKHIISLKQMKEQLDRLYHQSFNNNNNKNNSYSVQATSSSSTLNWSAWMPHWKRENTLLRGRLSKLNEEEDTQSDCSSTDCSSTHGSEAPSSTLVEN